jgi:hypothetical protein
MSDTRLNRINRELKHHNPNYKNLPTQQKLNFLQQKLPLAEAIISGEESNDRYAGHIFPAAYFNYQFRYI